ncbi:MAG TPA: sigma-70 family RNA polymerase sigma factor, partial [Aeromicrobium sp.]|nr:sigma-70 family RNA polymerase sigma factor [Aeromicrobium sp.]
KPTHGPGSERDLEMGELFDALERARTKRARQDLSDEIILRTIPVADRLASHYRYRGVSIDDLQQVARAALVQAMRRFRGGGENAFLAFAIPSIRGELKRHFRDREWTVRPPRRAQEARLAIVNAHSELVQELGHEPSVAELAAATGLDEQTIREARGVGHCYQPDSLDRPFDDSDGAGTLSTSKGEFEPGFEEAEARIAVGPLLDQLAPRDRKLIMLRFFEGLTQSETGRQIGISQMQVSRIENRILKEFRLVLEPDEAA